ncbi:uncharacterized protein LOC112088191 [Eutrema salsugineum]|uniref:uncharacterized protein LOC112088191 n=1 Tax=Eutrema salsugineum TaxID=72664 RepID=UPI000CED72E1|nr:uncharacterized protein LOC112088191 [Eutrema salsugineum]
MGRKMLSDITKKTKEAYTRLCEMQDTTMRTASDQAVEEDRKAYERWSHLAYIEEKYLRQKAKLFWLKADDQNTKAFYKAVKTRALRNKIKYTLWEVEDLESFVDFRCADADKQLLTHEVSTAEIRNALYSMPRDKAPGPDGYTVEFFKESWSIVGQDLLTAVQSFFKLGFLPKGINSTILALIPKKKEALTMKDYRPISCCNVIYKLISKILANRLKILLPKFIAPNQSAFVKNRLLMENLLLATELVKDYHKENISARCAMKIDISKAFDSVQWEFLLNTLRAMDFPAEFVHWIHLCISSASLSVQVNGELAGYFGSARGLWQGCSLSPYLFVICMNILSKRLDKAAQENLVSYHPGCKELNDVLVVVCRGHLIRRTSFWAVKDKTTLGSWIWKKVLKYRDLAKRFYGVKVQKGYRVSFWYEKWSDLGCLWDTLGKRACVDFGIPSNASLENVLDGNRSRRHQNRFLQIVEETIQIAIQQRNRDEEDVALWRGKGGDYKHKFNTKETGEELREPGAEWEPSRGIWFSGSTPKYSFIAWLTALNRLSTGSRMLQWNISAPTGCVFCDEPLENREYLFFSCPYTKQIWTKLMKGIMGTEFTELWTEVSDRVTRPPYDATRTFILRYIFQAAIHVVWCERNARRHGEPHTPQNF